MSHPSLSSELSKPSSSSLSSPALPSFSSLSSSSSSSAAALPLTAPLLLLHPQGPLGAVRSAMIVQDVTPELQREAETLRHQLQRLARLRAIQQAAADTLREGMNAAQKARTDLSEAVSNRTNLPQRLTRSPEQLRRIADSCLVEYSEDPRFPDDPVSINKSEFDAAYDEMREAGMPLRSDREQAWLDFAGWRVNYDKPLLALSQLTMAPEAPWTAERSPASAND